MKDDNLRITIISNWFSEKMGYAENCLPKALASLGHEVHLITSNAQVYFNSAAYKEMYEPFLGPNLVNCETKELDGYILHRLPYGLGRRDVRMKGLFAKLRELKPQIVQTFDAHCMTTNEVAAGKLFLHYKLFLENHIHASVFPPATSNSGKGLYWSLYPVTLGKLISAACDKCYPISTDAAEIAIRFLGINERKVEVCSLGVDTDLFRPYSDVASHNVRTQLRRGLGFSDQHIICIYTGRFSKDKAPIHMARAVALLAQEGLPFRGLFIGNGTLQDVKEIEACAGCVVHSFVPVRDLPPFYWASDIGVWPKQESTSQLDAAACGLPIVLSDRVQVRERVDGNGLLYKENDIADLASALKKLINGDLRRKMGNVGSTKVNNLFSWNGIAKKRAEDYKQILRQADSR